MPSGTRDEGDETPCSEYSLHFKTILVPCPGDGRWQDIYVGFWLWLWCGVAVSGLQPSLASELDGYPTKPYTDELYYEKTCGVSVRLTRGQISQVSKHPLCTIGPERIQDNLGG